MAEITFAFIREELDVLVSVLIMAIILSPTVSLVNAGVEFLFVLMVSTV